MDTFIIVIILLKMKGTIKMEKRILKIFALIAMLFIAILPTNFMAIQAAEGNKTIEYLPEFNGYLLKNVTSEEVLESFEKNFGYKSIDKKDRKSVSRDFLEKSKSLQTSYLERMLLQQVIIERI